MCIALLLAFCACRRKATGYFYDLEFTPKYEGHYTGERLLPVTEDRSEETIRLLTRLARRQIYDKRAGKLIRSAQNEVLQDFADSLRSLLRYQKGNARYRKNIRRADLVRRRYRGDPMLDKFVLWDEAALKQTQKMMMKTAEGIGAAGKSLVDKIL